MFNLETSGTGTFEAVTTDELKDHARIYTSDDDAYVTTLIDSATAQLEGDINTVIVNQAYIIHLLHWLDRSYYEHLFGFYGFTSDRWQYLYQNDCTPRIHLPVQPVSGLTQISFNDSDGNPQTLDTSLYLLRHYTDPAEVLWLDTSQLPDIQTNTTIDITFHAGFETADAVPALYKHAIKFLAAHWYERRESASELNIKSVPDAYDRIVNRLRVKRYR